MREATPPTVPRGAAECDDVGAAATTATSGTSPGSPMTETVSKGNCGRHGGGAKKKVTFGAPDTCFGESANNSSSSTSCSVSRQDIGVVAVGNSLGCGRGGHKRKRVVGSPVLTVQDCSVRSVLISPVALYLQAVDGVSGGRVLFSSPGEAVKQMKASYKALVSSIKPSALGKFGHWDFNAALRRSMYYALAWTQSAASQYDEHDTVISEVKTLLNPSMPQAEQPTVAEVRGQWMHAQVLLILETAVHHHLCLKCKQSGNLCSSTNSGIPPLADHLSKLIPLLRSLSLYLSVNRKEGEFNHYADSFILQHYTPILPPNSFNPLILAFELRPTNNNRQHPRKQTKPQRSKLPPQQHSPESHSQPHTTTTTTATSATNTKLNQQSDRLKSCCTGAKTAFLSVTNTSSTVVTGSMLDAFSLGF
ncbi:hypothetical protein Pelo_7367 [Pelomyxa schiedti]|nr:hypothetical protein Pelo_7367 [Pelomyxa schiedti]